MPTQPNARPSIARFRPGGRPTTHEQLEEFLAAGEVVVEDLVPPKVPPAPLLPPWATELLGMLDCPPLALAPPAPMLLVD